jgi:hypothetical protein
LLCFYFAWRDISTKGSYFLVIFFIVAFWYGVVPISGAVFSRHRWVRFRKRFNNLRLAPLLNYSDYRRLKNEGGVFRFTGEIDSITDGSTLWVKGEDLTISVSLKKTKCWLLPVHDGEGIPEPPEQVRWNNVSTLSEGIKVFIGGCIKMRNNRMSFVSAKEKPLTVIFYNCPDSALTEEIIRSARTRNEYWNTITPVSLVTGALSLIYIAASFLNRPAYRLTIITAIAAVFLPIMPMFPPGLLLTLLYRRITWHARKFRAYWDLVRLPLCYLRHGENIAILSTGEKYGFIKIDSPSQAAENTPFLIPEYNNEENPEWHFFGVLAPKSPEISIKKSSIDPFVSFGLLPGPPKRLAARYAIRAYTMEVFAWVLLLLGISINVIFIFIILSMLRLV